MKKLYYNKKSEKINRLVLVEKKRVILKSIILNTNISQITRQQCVTRLSNYAKVCVTTNQLVKKCIITKQRKIFNKNFKFSRLVLLRMARSGLVCGLVKTVW